MVLCVVYGVSCDGRHSASSPASLTELDAPSSPGMLPSSHISATLQGDAASLLALQRHADRHVAVAAAERDTTTAGVSRRSAGGCALAVATATGRRLCLEISAVVGHNGQQGLLKDLVDTLHLFAAALHVPGAHLLGNGEALLGSHGRQTLRLEHVDARLLETQIGLEADQDQRRVRAEMQDFGVPLLLLVEAKKSFINGKEGLPYP